MWDNLYVVVPEGVSWPLTLDAAEVAITDRFPQAATRREYAVVGRHDYLSFVIPDEEQERRGLYSQPGNLTLM